MPHREMAAARVDARVLDQRATAERGGDGREGFHELDGAEVARREAGARQDAVHDLEAGRERLQGIGVQFHGGRDARPRLQPEFGAAFRGAEQQQRGAVGDRRAVRHRVQVADFLQARDRRREQRIVAHRAERAEGRPEAGDVGRGHLRPHHLVAFDHAAIGARHRDHGRGITALRPGLAGALVRIDGDRVELLARQAFLGGQQVADDRRRHVAQARGEGGVGEERGAVALERRLRHALDAACQGQPLVAGGDSARSQRRGAHARDAVVVQRGGDGGIGQAGVAARHQRDVAALRTDLRDAAERDPLDRGQRGVAVAASQGRGQLRDQFVGRDAGEGAIGLALGARGADGIEQVHGFHAAHYKQPRRRLPSVPRPAGSGARARRGAARVPGVPAGAAPRAPPRPTPAPAGLPSGRRAAARG